MKKDSIYFNMKINIIDFNMKKNTSIVVVGP